MPNKPWHHATGPFRADQLRSADPYELDNGHPIECLPSGGRHSKANLTAVRRVEVHQPQVPFVLAYPGQSLAAPGVLSNPVPVEALYDPDTAHEAALRNLLQRRGYMDLDAVLEEGREAGGLARVMRLLERRVGSIAAADQQRIRALNRDQLTVLAEALASFGKQQDLADWLVRDD